MMFFFFDTHSICHCLVSKKSVPDNDGHGGRPTWKSADGRCDGLPQKRRNVPGLHVQLRVDKMGDLSSIGVWRSIHQQFAPLTASLLQRRFMSFVNPFSDDVIEARFICVATNRRRHR